MTMTADVSVSDKVSGSAHIKFIPISPTKLRRVVNLVRGKGVYSAVSVLDAILNRPAVSAKKAILSAVANAGGTISDDWIVGVISVDGGRKAKRFRPRARGRIYQECSQLSHIRIIVESRLAGGIQKVSSHGA